MDGVLEKKHIVEPLEATRDDLLVVNATSLNFSGMICHCFLDNFLISSALGPISGFMCFQLQMKNIIFMDNLGKTFAI